MRDFQLFKSLLFLVASLLILGSVAWTAENNQIKLSEINQLKAENYKLRIQLYQCSDAVTKSKLVNEQSELTEQFRKELNAKPEEAFDWNSLTFVNSNSNNKPPNTPK